MKSYSFIYNFRTKLSKMLVLVHAYNLTVLLLNLLNLHQPRSSWVIYLSRLGSKSLSCKLLTLRKKSTWLNWSFAPSMYSLSSSIPPNVSMLSEIWTIADLIFGTLPSLSPWKLLNLRSRSKCESIESWTQTVK